MSKKQSSIDWLEQELKKLPSVNVLEIFEQAKAMHKEQIIDAIFFGMQKGLNVNKVPETDNDWVNNYYNETFGGDND